MQLVAIDMSAEFRAAIRQVLAARDTATFQREWAALTKAVRATRLPEPASLINRPSPRGAESC